MKPIGGIEPIKGMEPTKGIEPLVVGWVLQDYPIKIWLKVSGCIVLSSAALVYGNYYTYLQD